MPQILFPKKIDLIIFLPDGLTIGPWPYPEHEWQTLIWHLYPGPWCRSHAEAVCGEITASSEKWPLWPGQRQTKIWGLSNCNRSHHWSHHRHLRRRLVQHSAKEEQEHQHFKLDFWENSLEDDIIEAEKKSLRDCIMDRNWLHDARRVAAALILLKA